MLKRGNVGKTMHTRAGVLHFQMVGSRFQPFGTCYDSPDWEVTLSQTHSRSYSTVDVQVPKRLSS